MLWASVRYGKTVRGTFVSRPNRFIAKVLVEGKEETVHVKNTGRCREILVPGTQVVLEDSCNPSRKTRYDLIAAYKGGNLINIDSQSPNKAFGEFIAESGIFGGTPAVHPEYSHGDSRFDFYIESEDRRIFVEVKGVTREFDGVCMFPDAPTERGLKHLRGLERCVEEGYEAYLALVVQMKGMHVFVPDYETHPEFGREMERAEEMGVGILVYDCVVTEDSMYVDSPVPHRYRHS